MDLRSHLDEMGVRYHWLHHDHPTYTAQRLAQEEHVSGKRVVKPVLVQADGAFVLCALPASYSIDMERLSRELNAQSARLAGEEEMMRVFRDCELGAEPPMGWMFGIPTVMDDSLCRQQEVLFQAGSHEEAVRMSMEDFVRVARPTVGHFAMPRSGG